MLENFATLPPLPLPGEDITWCRHLWGKMRKEQGKEKKVKLKEEKEKMTGKLKLEGQHIPYRTEEKERQKDL